LRWDLSEERQRRRDRNCLTLSSSRSYMSP